MQRLTNTRRLLPRGILRLPLWRRRRHRRQRRAIRNQSFIFGLVVIGGLIAAGVSQLSTFVVPNTILGIVGLSQVVYIGGKLVTSTNISDLNAAIAGLRSDEQKLKATAVAKKQGQVASLAEAIPLMGQEAYNAYRQKARDVAAIFTDATGLVVADASLEPIVT